MSVYPKNLCAYWRCGDAGAVSPAPLCGDCFHLSYDEPPAVGSRIGSAVQNDTSAGSPRSRSHWLLIGDGDPHQSLRLSRSAEGDVPELHRRNKRTIPL